MFKLFSFKKVENGECRFIPPPPPPQKHDDESEISDIRTYQELTFKALDKLIRKECKKGNSKLFLSHGAFYIGENMVEYLENKGFSVYSGCYFYVISW